MGAFRFTLDGRRIADARIAYGGMAATPKRAASAESALARRAGSTIRAIWSAALAALAARFHADRPTCARAPPIAPRSPPIC